MSNKLLLPLLIILAGCATGTTSVRGSLIKEYEISQLRTGSQTKRDVLQILGTPSTASTMNTDKWYYITDHTETKPLQKAQVVKRQILTLTFKDDVLDSVIKTDEKSAKFFRPDSEKTLTRGTKLGVIDQIIYNITSGVKQ